MEVQEKTFEEVKELLKEVIGEEFIEEYDLSISSTLTGDLEMESIEIVELSQKITVKYGQALNVPEWLAKMNLEDLVKLSIRDIVEFIDNAINN